MKRRPSSLLAALTITGLVTAAAASATPSPTEATPTPLSQVVTAHGQLGPGQGTLLVMLEPPKGAKLSEGAPYKLTGQAQGIQFETVRGKLDPNEPTLRLPVVVGEGADEAAQIDLKFSWCAPNRCVREKAQVSVKLDLSGDAEGGEAFFTYRAEGK